LVVSCCFLPNSMSSPYIWFFCFHFFIIRNHFSSLFTLYTFSVPVSLSFTPFTLCFVLSWRWWIWLIQRCIQNTKIRYNCLILRVWFGARVLMWLVGSMQFGTVCFMISPFDILWLSCIF
jgi:hypothetical protein